MLNACATEKSAKHASIVNAVVNDLEIQPLGDGRCTDENISAAALGTRSAKFSVEAPGPNNPG